MAEVEPVDLRPKTPEELAATLSNASGRPITAELIRGDIAEGAPANADGLLRLDAYLAWLAKVTNGSR